MKNIIFLFSFTASSLVSFNLLAEQDFSQSNLQQQEQVEKQSFSEEELAQMLAPIALYPDSLLTHILIASTYPIEIVEAHRWLIKNNELSSDRAAELVKDFDWDASVKALVPFERILSRLSEDLTWTQQLGDAFLQDESRLLDSIQTLRKQAELAGNLQKMDNMDVSYDDNNIVIEPVEKEVVYVPYYDTRMVYGAWHWSSYPPVYWKPRHNIYVSRYNPFYFHSGIRISFNYFFSAFHWHNRHVVVVNSHHSKHRYYEQRPRRLVANGGYAKRWSHQPVHRKGVAYRTKYTRSKYDNKRMKTRETSKKLHHVVQNKMHRNAKKNLPVINHKTNSRVKSKVSTINKRAIKTASKQYVSNDRYKDKTKKFKAQKVNQASARVKAESAKKVKPKTYKKTVKKYNYKSEDRASSKKKYKSSSKQKHKQSHRSASVKNHHSKSSKARSK
jgi:hypothetical protein